MVTHNDSIVIAGAAVEAPGGIDTLGDYWTALAEARDLIGPFPRDRGWSIDRLLQPAGTEGWGGVSDAGGFLSDAAAFDPSFFGLTPREAVAMDPQQRVGLRVAWRALENAGYNPDTLDGAEVGCYMGISVSEYGPRVDELNDHTGYRATGSALGAGAGRISHTLGLVGPSVSVDTACASSLTALHLAVNAVRNDECEWALAGGVCVMGSLGGFYEFARTNALAPDGRCMPYSAHARGTVWGEGAGVVVVERESRARSRGHRVYGHVMATRVNHNGKSPAIAVPSSAAQEQLIRKTVAAAGIPAEYIGMIEGHGTGTTVGDPIELLALQRVYGSGARTMLGSVKSNLGHAQAAGGILGLIKVLLCGLQGRIAPTRFTEEPTRAVDWDASSVCLADRLQEWIAHDGVRYGAISSFGIAGTNAHAIVAMPGSEETRV